ncbi:MAG: DUF3810 family protein [Candidatus Velthaea sp.]
MRLTGGRIADLAAIALAVALQRAPIPRAWIENDYANGTYATLARTLVPLSNRVPFAIGDVLVAGIAAALAAYWIANMRRARARRWRTAGLLLLRTAGIAAAAAIWFDAAWALNYRRDPVIHRVAYDGARVTAKTVSTFSRRIVEDLNRTAPLAHAERESSAQMEAALARAFAPVASRLGDRWPVAVSRPKATVFQFWFAAAGVGGQWDPFAYETIVNAEFLPFELPFALAHEWGHVAGFGDESDANLIGALTCLRSSDPLVHYSGLFWSYGFLPENDRQALKVSPLVYADLVASRDRFLRHYNKNVFAFQWFAYDKYLRANRVPAGVASYSLFVRVLVGTPLDRDGLPLPRGMKARAPRAPG